MGRKKDIKPLKKNTMNGVVFSIICQEFGCISLTSKIGLHLKKQFTIFMLFLRGGCSNRVGSLIFPGGFPLVLQ